MKKRRLDFDRLQSLFGPLAERNGFKRQDGNAVLERLLEITELDPNSIARRFSTDPVLSSRILDNYLKTMMASTEIPDMSRLAQQIKTDASSLKLGKTFSEILSASAVAKNLKTMDQRSRAASS